MPKKIKRITKVQAARFGEWAEKWIAIGLSTEPADFDRATAAAFRVYKAANLNRPMVTLRVGSPYAATLSGALAWAMLREIFGNKKITKQVQSQVRSQVQSQVGSQVRSQVWSQVWSQVGSQVRSQVWSQVGSQVRSQVRSQVESQIWSVPANSYHGALWASWSAYVSFIRDVLGWDDPILERFVIDEDLICSCGWVWWHENVLVISDRPELIRRDDQGRLHCEDGPAIAYRDGWVLHAWRGAVVPAEWIESPRSLAPSIALKWENIEQRRAACEILGWDKIIKSLKPKVINTNPDPMIGELLEVDLPDSGKERFLRVRCATGRVFALPVPPNMETALEANASTYGVDPETYSRLEIRT